MAISVSGSGQYQSQVPYKPYATNFFFSGIITDIGNDYQNAPDPSNLTFGGNLSNLIINNQGTTAIAFQWGDQGYQNHLDHGIVLGGQQIQLFKAYKGSIRFRCAEPGSTGSVYIWGI